MASILFLLDGAGRSTFSHRKGQETETRMHPMPACLLWLRQYSGDEGYGIHSLASAHSTRFPLTHLADVMAVALPTLPQLSCFSVSSLSLVCLACLLQVSSFLFA